ncbi:MAG TPA: hypothetical protein VGH54_15690 [Mycobacterium sp.]|uniref:hypothetical protein n=1 Tax=Mycobacterium sp. TaxID=1785 RepID=UPI002F40AEB7
MASQTDLFNAAVAAGLPSDKAHVAAAIGMAESGGNLTSHNTNAATGDDSYGAWQINMLGAMGPKRRVLFGISNNDQLYDLKTNAHAMAVLSSNGADFNDWSTFKDGAYKPFLDNHLIQSGGTDPNAGQSSGGISGALGQLQSGIETLNKTAQWVSNSQNWVRVGYVVGGGAMILVGLVMMIQSTTLGSAITQVIPAGRVASLAKKGTS